ncbi:hypothetical protein [Magnetococcus sp. PR-3]|uniref:hypothetical protein n=1 Tax=Magnetococcus sp. PR-3 TaxID=3120355 RepID=UPI002FCDECA5
MDVNVIPATQAHVDFVLKHIRPQDRMAAWIYTGKPIEQALPETVAATPDCHSVLVAGEPVALCGVAVASLLGGVGMPWVLGTEAMTQNPIRFLRHSRRMVVQMRRAWPHLVNVVADDNTPVKQWLQWLGFELSAPFAYGRAGRMFRRFEIRGAA